MRPVRVLLAAVMLSLVACSGSGSGPSSSLSPLPILTGADNPNQPYGIVAIEYHFHDAHPSLPLATTRTVTWTNEGTLTHNVTIPQINFSQDFQPGKTITIKDLGKKLGGPGVYTFFCRFHEQLGMVGTLIIK